MRLSRYVIRALGTILAATIILATQTNYARALDAEHALRIEPNVLVSLDGTAPHLESDVAVNPLRPDDLVGYTTVMSQTVGPTERCYTSLDGGYTWSETTPPGSEKNDGGDPRVVFTNHGTALAISIDETNRGMDVYRSTDGGSTWSARPARFPIFDHELVAVDRSQGRFSNRVYVVGEGYTLTPHNPMGDRFLRLYTSDDDGRSFALRSVAATSLIGRGRRFDKGGVSPSGLAVLRDGTVVVGFARYASFTDKKTKFEADYVVASTDGGRTFGQPSFIANQYSGITIGPLREQLRGGDVSQFSTWFVMAADISAGPYRDRLYHVWVDHRFARISYVYSSDRGKTWSPRRQIGSVSPDEAQFQPMVAVSNRGVVAITWYSTAGYPNRRHFNAYAAVSNNGGESFTKPYRVSSQPSMPQQDGNLRPYPLLADEELEKNPRLMSAYSRWPNGGDYVGLAADTDGIFHFYWPDSRGPTYQIYSARLHAYATTSEATTGNRRDVTSKIRVAFDPITIHPEQNEIDVPIRIRNISMQTIHPPLVVTYLGERNSDEVAERLDALPPPQVLNADNGEHSSGATFDYSKALGTYGLLPPGGVSEPIVWRIRLSALDVFLQDLTFKVRIAGSIP